MGSTKCQSFNYVNIHILFIAVYVGRASAGKYAATCKFITHLVP